MESDIDELDKQRHRSLHLKVNNKTGAENLLVEKGYQVKIIENEILEILGLDSISKPENMASLLVENGFPPSLLKVEEEDLEAFFLRTIKDGGTK